MLRTQLLTALLVALAGLPLAAAQETRLPEIGSSAARLITPAEEAEYGRMLIAQLRHYDYLLEDPLLDSWLDTLGHRLAGASDDARRSYRFFMLRERQINAFATLGGHVGVNAGLVLAADREDEVAGVLAHEVAHVTQEHVLRSVERAQRDQLPMLLAMLGAIAVSQRTGGNSGDDAGNAVIAAAVGIAQQRQINYTRSNESEADRIGMQTLVRSRFDPTGMADFFAKLQARSRSNAASLYGETPDYLRSHPVTTTRITEAKERAERIARSPQPAFETRAADNPLLPGGLVFGATAPNGGATGLFDVARERLRVMSALTPAAAVKEYEDIKRARALKPAERYGLAVAHLQAGQARQARPLLEALVGERPQDTWLQLGLAEAEAASGDGAAADARLERLLRQAPTSRPIVLTYARILGERSGANAGKRAQAILRPLLPVSGDDAVFQKLFARASEMAGDTVRAGEAHAEAAYLSGRPEMALVQLNTLKRREDVDYYARARIDARIAAITPTVLELKRQGIRDPDVER
ncbi:M48 family metalloprotease [Lysobacter humi (ex Lee et al. 2017)]